MKNYHYQKQTKTSTPALGLYKIDHNMTFADLCEYYYEKRRKIRKSTSIQNDMYSLKKFEELNDVPAFAIQTEDIRKILDRMYNDNCKPSYINKIHATISKLFTFALDEELIYMNPMRKLAKYHRPDELVQEMQFWNYEEFTQFIECIDQTKYKEYHLLYNFLYFMGCRKGEALALTWEDVNFVTNVIRINKTVTQQLRGIGYKLTPPKTKNSLRSIKMPTQLAEMLKDYYNQICIDETFDSNWFVMGKEKPLGLKYIGPLFKENAIKAGVKVIRIHDLRHSHASLLINNGANIKAISARLGDNVDTILNVYTHLFQETEDELVRIIEKVTQQEEENEENREEKLD